MFNQQKLSILLIGNELLNGDIQDKNAQYLLKKINGSTLEASRIIYVRDEAKDIKEAVLSEMTSSRLVICSGGLGPTSDDITVSSIAEALELPLVEDAAALERLKGKYAARNRPMNTNSLKQVLFPKGAEILQNDVGTADSCITTMTKDGWTSSVVCLPGVPKEFSYILDNPLWEWIQNTLSPERIENSVDIRIFGLAESVIGTAIDESKILPPEISVAYRPQFPEILLSLKSKTISSETLETYVEKLASILDSSCFYTREKNTKLPQTVAQLCKEKNKTFALAESCTGGRVASEITKIPGSSEFFKGGLVVYSNEAKVTFLDVPPGLLRRVGAVSEECATYMSNSLFSKTGADYAISITGIAGPDGGTTKKKVGTIYIGLTTHDTSRSFKLELPWDRERNQIYAAWVAMDIVRRHLLGLPLEAQTL